MSFGDPNKEYCDIYFTAGETIAFGVPLYLELNGGSNTAGRVYRCDNTDPAKSISALFVGFSVGPGTAGNPVRVRMIGIVPGFSSLTVGRLVYASTPGNATQTYPNTNYVLPVGIAVTTTTVLINNQRNNAPVVSFTRAGYCAGGSVFTQISKLYFNIDTFSAINGALSTARAGCSGLSDVTDGKGYFIGGDTTSSSAAVVTADKITYSSDTVAAQASANLSAARSNGGPASDNTDGKGYIAGGNTSASSPIGVATADKVTYSTDTTAAQSSANLSAARGSLAGISNNANGKGYFAGGTSNATAGLTTADKITYSTNTTAAQSSANLSSARYFLAGISDDTDGKGYFVGGTTATVTSAVATADKITYSNDTTAAQSSANLSVAKNQHAGISDNTGGKGYFIGGSTGSGNSNTVDIITYSGDTTSASTVAVLSQAPRTKTAGISISNT